MRTLAYPDERTVLGSGHYWIVPKVEVQNASAVWVDLTNLAGRNWLQSATITASIDQPVMSGTLSLARAQYDSSGVRESLAPLLAASGLNRDGSGAYAPLLNPGRQVRISVATVPAGSDAATIAAAQRVLVVGKLDAVNWEADPITLPFRDLGAYLLDAMIERAGLYGADDGSQTAEQVMQAILDAWPTGAGALTLYTPTPSSFAIREYQQDPGPELEALRNIALQRGGDVRYAFDASNNFRLTFAIPDRAKTVADFTLPPSEYLDVRSLNLSDADVRNVVEVVYTDKASGETARVTRTDAGSVTAFGRRFMRLLEEAATNIDTATEATTLADAALADLAAPPMTHAVESLLLPIVELGDLVNFPANGTHYDAPQALAVVGYTHELTAGGGGRTTLETRGTPAGAYRDWLEREGGAIPAGVTAPAPEWGPLYGESSSYGGEVGASGAVWQAVTLDANTARVVIHNEQTPPPGPAPMPNIGDNATRAIDLPRPEGAIGKRSRWTSIVRMATPPDWAKTSSGYGIGASGAASVNGGEQRSPIITRQAVATDITTGIEPGALASLSVARQGTANVLTIARASSPTPASPYPILLLICRDGVNIDQVAPPVVGTPLVYSDNDLDPQKSYTYHVFCWSQGVSGARRQWQTGQPVPQPDPGGTTPATNPPPPVNTDPTPTGDPPVWATISGTATPYYDSATDDVAFAWTCADPGATSIGVEFWTGNPTATYHAVALDSGTGTAAAGTAEGGNVYTSGYYRLVSFGSGGFVRLATSEARHFKTPFTAPAPGGAL